MLLLTATSGDGRTALVEAVAYRTHLGPEGLRRRRARRAAREIGALTVEVMRWRMGASPQERLAALADDVVAGRTDPWAAADRVVAAHVGRDGRP